MLTVYVQVAVDIDSAARALEIGAAAGYEGHLDASYPDREDGRVVLSYSMAYPLFEDRGAGPEQQDTIDALHAALTEIDFVVVGNGVSVGAGDASKWILRPAGNDDPAASLSFFAVDRKSFEMQLRSLAAGSFDYEQWVVDVYGMAVNDADVQGHPFRLHPEG